MSDAVWLSISVAAAGTALSLPPAVLVAWYLERSKLPGRGLVHALVMMPLVLPPVVVGYVLLLAFSPRRWLGRTLAAIGVPVAFHWSGAVLASAIVGFPLFVMTIGLALKSVDPRLELASRCLGRSAWSSFWRITVPLSWPGILAGATIAFARGLGEFGATIVFAGRIAGQTDTLALRIYGELDAVGGEARVVPLVLASIVLAIAAVALARGLDAHHRRRLELDR